MGYIFEAMNRSAGDEPTKPPEVTPDVAPAVAADVTRDVTPATAPPEPSRLTLETSAPQPAPAFTGASREKASSITASLRRADSGAKLRFDDRLVAATEPASVMAEEYRAIRTSMLARYEHKRHLVHTITSATPQEGKTITSLNLGLSFAELHNRKTIVLEADLRLPQFANLLNLPAGPGVVDVLEGQASIERTIITIGDNHLHVLPAGAGVADQAVQLLSSAPMARLIQTLRQRYDHVIIDTPPVVELADAGILGTMSDDVILVARMNRTPRPLIEQAIRTLASYHAPVGGMIATDHQPTRKHYYKYGYRYRDETRGRRYAKAA